MARILPSETDIYALTDTGLSLGRSVEEVLAGDYLISKGPLDPYAAELARGVGENLERIDEALRSTSRNWALDRMPGADRNLLRLAVFEMSILEDDRPDQAVVIDEAVEIAKAYGTDESARFVNGVLGRIARAGELPGLLSAGSNVSAEDAEAACIAALWFEIDPARERQRRRAAAALEERGPRGADGAAWTQGE